MAEMSKQYEYFAFISYKREDEKWAKWLQKKLESYSLPTAIRKENPELPNKIRPVFRDQSELSGGNLKAEIEKGLNRSKYLIVICSPRSAKSPWVSKEVQHFIDQGRENYIIPFIIGGTPNASIPEDESFPEGLRRLTGEKEILGININEMGRNAAAIKVIARMFNLRFDALWQRYEKEKRRRNLITTVSIMALMFAAIAISLILWNKNSTIERQNEQLTSLIKSLEEENKTVSQLQSNSDRYIYSGSLRGNESRDFLLNVSYHPTEPIIVFSDDWGYWVHYIRSNTEVMLSSNDEPESVLNVYVLGYTNDGQKIFASSWGGIFEWDADDFQLTYYDFDSNMIDSLLESPNIITDEGPRDIDLDSLNHLCGNIFRYENNFVIATRNRIEVSTKLHDSIWPGLQILYNRPFNEVLFLGSGRAALYDEKEHAFVQFFKGYDSDFAFSPSGEYLRIGKDIFTRNIRPDTISHLPYKTDVRSLKNLSNKGSNPLNIRIKDNTIYYNFGGHPRKIEVIRNSSMGNGQEYLKQALYCPHNKIIAVVEQGKHRIYNAKNGTMLGTMDSYVWDENESMGHELELSHAESSLVSVKVIDKKLYVVSSGGILRIYDIDKIRLQKVVELPHRFKPGTRLGAVEYCEISDDGSSIRYSFYDEPTIYSCKLPSLR